MGRTNELARLAAWAPTAEAWTTIVLRGPAGVGKTTTGEMALARWTVEDPGLRVVRGRCYEHEHAPHKGFDGVTDLLLDRLEGLREDDRRTAGLLLPGVPAEDAARHQLAPLVDRLLGARPAALWIDDLQWIDRDGLALLAELLAVPPSGPRLMVATCRDTPQGDAVLAQLADAPSAPACTPWTWPPSPMPMPGRC